MKRKAVLSKKISVWYGVIMVLIAIICIGTYYSYAMFTVEKIKGNAISIVTGELVYEISGSDITNQEISVKGNEIKILEVVIKSENEIESKYKLYYEETEEAEVNVIKGEGESEGQIETEEKRVTIVIRNQSNSTKTIKIGVQGGLVNNGLVLEEGREALGEEERYSIGTRSVTGGSVRLNKSSGVEGQTISFTTTPNTNFTYQGATIRDSAGNVIKTLSSSTKSFTLTNEDVVVSPKWKYQDTIVMYSADGIQLNTWSAGKKNTNYTSIDPNFATGAVGFQSTTTSFAVQEIWSDITYDMTHYTGITIQGYGDAANGYYLIWGVMKDRNSSTYLWDGGIAYQTLIPNKQYKTETFTFSSQLTGKYYLGVGIQNNYQIFSGFFCYLRLNGRVYS